MRRVFAAWLLIYVAWSGIAGEVAAQDWAKAMFDHTTHDFGMVARGAEAEHRFTIENIYLEDAHIKSVSSSCQCTSLKLTRMGEAAEVKEPFLKTHEKLQIVATLNTRQFTGSKDATIRVVLDKPFPAEVQLHVRSYIRTDVVLEPGSVRFGQVTEGTAAVREINLRHAGSSDWRITGIENQDENIDVAVKPVSTGSSQTVYDLTFTLKATAPVGYVRRHVTLLTNDQNPNAQRVLVPIEGVVAPSVSARPSPLSFGLVRPGREAISNLVIQAQDSSFQILELIAPDERFGFGSSVKLNTPSRLHLVPVTFSAGTQPGKISGQILIRTDIGGGRVLRVDVTGEVVGESEEPPASPAPAENTAGGEKKPADGWRAAEN